MTTAVLLHGAYGAPSDWTEPLSGLQLPFELPVSAPALDEQLTAAELDRFEVDEIAVRLLDRLEERLPAGPLVLGGYSLGTRLALGLAVRPSVASRLQGLLLVSGTAGLESPDERRRRSDIDDERAQALVEDPQAFLRAFWSLPLFAGLSSHHRREALLEQRTQRAAIDPVRLAKLMRGLSVGRMAPLWSLLGDIPAKTLVLCGEADVDYVRQGRRLAEAFPHGRQGIIERAGHALLLEAPAEVGRALSELFEPSPSLMRT
jgi:2-succinyl-6-hydroxy-2,4-cyclohexadiene-1-carboxylate synthase